jgi:hypothetical protein
MHVVVTHFYHRIPRHCAFVARQNEIVNPDNLILHVRDPFGGITAWEVANPTIWSR